MGFMAKGKSLHSPQIKTCFFGNRSIFCLRSPMADHILGKGSPSFIAGGLKGSLEGLVKRNVIVAAALEPHYPKPLPLCLDAR